MGVCEDKCVKTREEEDGTQLVCGSTKHLTSFGVLFGGVGAGDGCGDSDDNLITGSWIGDLFLALGVAGFMCCCCTILALLGTFNPTVRRFLKGGMTESQIRKMEAKARERELEHLSASSSSMDV